MKLNLLHRLMKWDKVVNKRYGQEDDSQYQRVKGMLEAAWEENENDRSQIL